MGKEQLKQISKAIDERRDEIIKIGEEIFKILN